MSYITRNLRQDVQTWARGTPDGFGGFTWTKNTQKARWEERTELFRDDRGQERAADTVIYLTDDVDVGSWIMLGTSTASDPTDEPSAREIVSFRKIPDLRARRFERKALLAG